ncbi:MAG: helix-turn-helix transcriptional regulator [Vallitaleaceae bacterium]|nr:helix-turn-helix transcriptional regulator [Vallitaleaceae bacterium]
MNFKHRLDFMMEEEFLFHFRHHNEKYLLQKIETWQKEEVENETPLLLVCYNMLILFTQISRILIHQGIPSAALLEKIEFAMDIAYSLKTLDELHRHERRHIHEFFSIYLLKTRKTDHLIVNQVLNYIYIRLHEKLSLSQIAKDLKLSESHLSHEFKEAMGLSIMEYFRQLKVERSKFFLRNTQMPLIEISELLGFYDQSHFTKVFKEYSSQTPRSYRYSQS